MCELSYNTGYLRTDSINVHLLVNCVENTIADIFTRRSCYTAIVTVLSQVMATNSLSNAVMCGAPINGKSENPINVKATTVLVTGPVLDNIPLASSDEIRNVRNCGESLA